MSKKQGLPELKIVITRKYGGWRFQVGKRYTDGLCWDEMLGMIAYSTHPMNPELKTQYACMTVEDWRKHKQALKTIRSNHD